MVVVSASCTQSFLSKDHIAEVACKPRQGSKTLILGLYWTTCGLALALVWLFLAIRVARVQFFQPHMGTKKGEPPFGSKAKTSHLFPRRPGPAPVRVEAKRRKRPTPGSPESGRVAGQRPPEAKTTARCRGRSPVATPPSPASPQRARARWLSGSIPGRKWTSETCKLLACMLNASKLEVSHVCD